MEFHLGAHYMKTVHCDGKSLYQGQSRSLLKALEATEGPLGSGIYLREGVLFAEEDAASFKEDIQRVYACKVTGEFFDFRNEVSLAALGLDMLPLLDSELKRADVSKEYRDQTSQALDFSGGIVSHGLVRTLKHHTFLLRDYVRYHGKAGFVFQGVRGSRNSERWFLLDSSKATDVREVIF